MALPKYTYFNVRARGELPRLVALVGGIKFEDNRVKFSDWPEFKPNTPFGQIPMLTIGDQCFAQKMAIAKYFGRKSGLYPANGDEMEALKLDQALCFTDEILDNILEGCRHKKFDNNPETLEKVKKETLPAKLPKLEQLLKANGTGFFAGNKLSLADLNAFDILEHVVDLLGKDSLDAYPLLKANFQKVGDIPAIKNYVANRPTPEDGFDF